MTKETTYGQKGGEGPNKGRKATTYRAILPDGSVVEKKSFFESGPTALMAIYQHEEKWYVANVLAADSQISHYHYATILADRV